jgi:hypothetical protein
MTRTLDFRKDQDFVRDLTALINRYSLENNSDTPDYILANYLFACLMSFDTATQQRDTHYGRDARPREQPPHNAQAKRRGGCMPRPS